MAERFVVELTAEHILLDTRGVQKYHLYLLESKEVDELFFPIKSKKLRGFVASRLRSGVISRNKRFNLNYSVKCLDGGVLVYEKE
jgi:hypothetical protein